MGWAAERRPLAHVPRWSRGAPANAVASYSAKGSYPATQVIPSLSRNPCSLARQGSPDSASAVSGDPATSIATRW